MNILFCRKCQKNLTGVEFDYISRKLKWQGRQDLNLRHLVLETSALPTELLPYRVTALMIMHSFSVVTGKNFSELVKPAIQ